MVMSARANDLAGLGIVHKVDASATVLKHERRHVVFDPNPPRDIVNCVLLSTMVKLIRATLTL